MHGTGQRPVFSAVRARLVMASLSPLSPSSASAPHLSPMYLTHLCRGMCGETESEGWRGRLLCLTLLCLEQRAEPTRSEITRAHLKKKKSREIDNCPALVSKIIIENVLAMNKWL